MCITTPQVPIAVRNSLRRTIPLRIQELITACNVEKGPGNCSHVLFFGANNFFSYPYDAPRNAVRYVIQTVALSFEPGC